MKGRKKIVPIIVLTATLFLSTAISIMGMKVRKEDNAQMHYSVISSSVYEAVSNEITRPIYTSLTLANDVLLIDVLRNEEAYDEEEAIGKISQYLAAVKESIHANTAFLVSEKTKRYYYAEGLNKVIDIENDEHDVWYSIFTNTRKPYDLDVDADQTNGNSWTVFVNARVEDENGNLLGVCGIGLSMERLQELLKDYENKYHIKINFIDSDGLVQVDTDTINIENSYLYDVQYGKEKDGYSYKNNRGEYVVMRYVEQLNWYLVLHGEDASIKGKEIFPVVLGSVIVILINAGVYLICTKNKEN